MNVIVIFTGAETGETDASPSKTALLVTRAMAAMIHARRLIQRQQRLRIATRPFVAGRFGVTVIVRVSEEGPSERSIVSTAHADREGLSGAFNNTEAPSLCDRIADQRRRRSSPTCEPRFAARRPTRRRQGHRCSLAPLLVSAVTIQSRLGVNRHRDLFRALTP